MNGTCYDIILLIEPLGIETSILILPPRSDLLLLIEPLGIETIVRCS